MFRLNASAAAFAAGSVWSLSPARSPAGRISTSFEPRGFEQEPEGFRMDGEPMGQVEEIDVDEGEDRERD